MKKLKIVVNILDSKTEVLDFCYDVFEGIEKFLIISKAFRLKENESKFTAILYDNNPVGSFNLDGTYTPL